MALLLGLGDSGQAEDRLAKSAASRACLWLTRQQTATGLWPSSYSTGEKDFRIVRLDLPEYRDATLAVLLACASLEDPMLRKSAERSAQQLVNLRISDGRMLKGLWDAAYELNGTPSDRIVQQARAVDVLAGRHAMQTLLAVQVGFGDASTGGALQAAADAMTRLRYEDGLWQRLYPVREGDRAERVKGKSPGSAVLFASTRPTRQAMLEQNGAYGIPGILSAAATVKDLGTDGYQTTLERGLDVRQSLARTLVGLSDEPLEIVKYSPDDPAWQALAGDPPKDLAGRIRRIDLLLLRMKLQRQP